MQDKDGVIQHRHINPKNYTEMKKMKEKIQQLAFMIEGEHSINEDIQQKKKEFEEKYVDLFTRRVEISANISKLKEEITPLAIEEFNKTGNKKLIGGVGIREITKLIYEETKAFFWAKEHSIALIPESLDKRAFEKIAKTEKIGFVTINKNPIVTYPNIFKFE